MFEFTPSLSVTSVVCFYDVTIMKGWSQMDTRRKLTQTERFERKKIFENARPAMNVKRGDMLKGRVYNIADEGAFILTDEKYIGFIHASEQTQPLKEGMTVEGRVTFVRADGRINLSLRPQKEYARVADAERIHEYLKKRNGSMPYNDSSPPEIIREKFGISKASFKRALGKLFKEGLIEEKEGWITLINRDGLS